jgi:ATP-binding cassette subfamily B protein
VYFDRRLWAFTAGVRGRIAWCVAIGMAAAAAGIARLGLLGWLIYLVFSGAGLGELAMPAVLVAGVMALRAFLDYKRAMVAHETASQVQRQVRQRIYDHVAELGPAYFGAARTGDVLLSMVEGVEQLETYFGQYLPQFFVAALTPVLIFAFVAFLDLPIAAVLLAAALATLFAPALWHKLDSAKSGARQKAYEAFASEFLDSIQGLATLKAFGQSEARAELLERRSDTLFKTTMWVLGTNTLARGITDTGIALGAAVALGWGAIRVVGGEMDLLTLLIILMLGTEVFRPLRDLRSLLHQGMIGTAAAEGIFRLLAAKAVVTAGPGSVGRLEPTIAFENVRFSYPGGRGEAHDGLDFSLKAGERVGIVGPSGSGKSTIVRLLLRLYDPDSGRVTIGGRDLRDLPLEAVREQIAVVNQDTYLFHGTVAENLLMGRPEASRAELDSAARSANAHEFIARLPQGYDTMIGERGLRLSGGQRQRIAIARAILRDSPILILDEALSSVDAENEAVIQEALERLMTGRTTLIIAHRLSSVIGADRIMVIDAGHIAESGSHKELMARKGYYHDLMSAQAAEGRKDAGATVSDILVGVEKGPEEAAAVPLTEPTDAILRAEGMGWLKVFKVLVAMIAPRKGQLAATFFFGVTRVLAFIGIGVISALTVLAVKRGEPFDAYLIALGVLAPLAGILHWTESWLAHDMAYRLLGEMRVAFFRKLDRLAPAYLLRRRTGDLVGVATHDIEMVEYFFAHTVAPAFVAVLIPAAVLVILATFAWPIALALLPFLAFAGLHPVLVRKRIDDLGSRARESLGDLNAHAVDSVQGLAEIVAFQQVETRGDAFAAKVHDYVNRRMPLFRDLTLQQNLQELATGLGALAVVVTGGVLAGQGAIEPGILPLLTLLAMAAFLPVSEIAQVGRQLADTLGATRRVHAVDIEPVPVTDGLGALPAPRADAPALEMIDVTFNYPGRGEPALAEVTFSAAKGTTTALVGPSGAGKSTIASLFLRFWDPQTGAVLMGGHDIREAKLDDLRRRIALVAQDTYLFNDTIRANVLIARPEASEAEVRDALERVALLEFVESLPKELDTVVGERGAQLSGGQRQRVAIARAFLKDAPILVLDEATSHLDAISEQVVRGALTELMATRTTVVIAHRLSTIRDADQIVVLSDGRVAEIGGHDDLLAKGGLYAHLVSRQLSSATEAAAE